MDKQIIIGLIIFFNLYYWMYLCDAYQKDP